MSTTWDPGQYLKFEDERGRPFADLLSRVAHPDPRQIVDLGCGPGNMTAKLQDRWPEARVIGIDSSAEMIDRALPLAIPGRLEFVQQDVREWRPDAPVDVLLSNATLQWVPGHVDLFRRFIGALSPGGVFAFQVPANFTEPSHTILADLAASERWRDVLGQLVTYPPVLAPDAYLSAVAATGARPDVWETTYLHVLHGPDAVLQWLRATGLRPALTALAATGHPGDTEEFLASYSSLLTAAYPTDRNGDTVFPFRRIFAVASLVAPA
jgi:trans-aconitate 2-methyltransferase